MLIRKMTMEDIRQVVEIEAQCFSLPWSQTSFEDSLKRDDTVFLVCEQNKSDKLLTKLQNNTNPVDKIIIGYIGMYLSFEEGEITNVAVLPSARKQGIGERLIKEMKKVALQQKIERIVLEVRVSNQPAINLYEKNDFRSIGIRKNFYEKPVEDANIMVCELSMGNRKINRTR